MQRKFTLFQKQNRPKPVERRYQLIQRFRTGWARTLRCGRAGTDSINKDCVVDI
jgi:hypothetical protein